MHLVLYTFWFWLRKSLANHIRILVCFSSRLKQTLHYFQYYIAKRCACTEFTPWLCRLWKRPNMLTSFSLNFMGRWPNKQKKILHMSTFKTLWQNTYLTTNWLYKIHKFLYFSHFKSALLEVVSANYYMYRPVILSSVTYPSVNHISPSSDTQTSLSPATASSLSRGSSRYF